MLAAINETPVSYSYREAVPGDCGEALQTGYGERRGADRSTLWNPRPPSVRSNIRVLARRPGIRPIVLFRAVDEDAFSH